MRIIAGTRRGHKLCGFDGDDVRPTTDRVKESVFNLIQTFVPDAVCLDMFAGSGALSLEALSRGAASAVCVDKDKRSIEIINRNITDLNFGDSCKAVNMSCFDYIDGTSSKFDIVFLDPPYNQELIEPALKAIVENDILNSGGIAVLESDTTDFHSEIEGLSVLKQRSYGRTYITIYKRS